MTKIVDYGMGNCGSIKNMFRYLGIDAEIITRADDLKTAKTIVLPGVGAYDHGVKHLEPFKSVLEEKVLTDKTPFLGICLGMQLLLQGSDEGTLPGLGWIPGHAKRFDFSGLNKLAVPHMGWNEVYPSEHSKLLPKLPEGYERFYFAHSYHAIDVPKENIMASSHYGYEFVCAIQKGNIMGVQFHPEKSHKFGKAMFSRFVGMSQC